MTCVHWSIEKRDVCPTCGNKPVLICAPAQWYIDSEDVEELSIDDEAVEPEMELTGTYCRQCDQLLSLTANVGGLV